MNDRKSDALVAKTEKVKRVYSAPRLTDIGSVETLSLSGTSNPKGENPGAHKANKP
jgi:hypothetical protein